MIGLFRAAFAGALGAICLLIVFPMLARPAVASADYEGHMLASEDSSDVRLTLRGGPGEKRRARFSVVGLKVVCEDDTFPTVSFTGLKLRFFSRHGFEGEHYQSSVDGDATYYLVRGRIDGRTATGTVTYIDDPFDPPEGPYQPDCTTSDADPWRATR